MFDRLLSPDEFADLVSLSAESVRRRCREGSIPGARRMGKRLWRIPESSLLRMGSAVTRPTPNPRRLPENPVEREAFWRDCDRALMAGSKLRKETA